MKHVRRRGGGRAVLDDMSAAGRAWALLVEHAAQRRLDGYVDGEGRVIPCACDECRRHRAAIIVTAGPDDTLIVGPAP
jgi:hypothetical protein